MEVTYKTAQKAKEFGFQEKCFGFYDSDRNLQTIEDIIEMKGDSIKYYNRTLLQICITVATSIMFLN